MHRIVLLLLTFGCVFSADLPAAAQRELDTYTAAVAKADAIRQAAVDKAVDAAVKALDAVSRKAASAEERRAIDDKILEIKKARSVDDLLNEGSSLPPPLRGLVGKWTYKVSGDPYTWDIKADGTLMYTYKGGEPKPAKWEYKKQENVVHIQYNEKNWDDIVLPIDPNGTKVNNHFYGAGSGTATKLEEKR